MHNDDMSQAYLCTRHLFILVEVPRTCVSCTMYMFIFEDIVRDHDEELGLM